MNSNIIGNAIHVRRSFRLDLDNDENGFSVLSCNQREGNGATQTEIFRREKSKG